MKFMVLEVRLKRNSDMSFSLQRLGRLGRLAENFEASIILAKKEEFSDVTDFFYFV